MAVPDTERAAASVHRMVDATDVVGQHRWSGGWPPRRGLTGKPYYAPDICYLWQLSIPPVTLCTSLPRSWAAARQADLPLSEALEQAATVYEGLSQRQQDKLRIPAVLAPGSTTPTP